MGMAVLILTGVVFSVSAGYFLLRTAFASDTSPGAPVMVDSQADVESGKDLFARHCASCHYADREDRKLGPGLKGLFQRERPLLSGGAVNEESVRRQMIAPFGRMPSFATLPEPDIADLIAYLRTL